MKPSLYAPTTKEMWPRHRDAMNRILPTRCPQGDDGKIAYHQGSDGYVEDCPFCEGRGWLYPPMPDYWDHNHDSESIFGWNFFCREVWRAMGILDE